MTWSDSSWRFACGDVYIYIYFPLSYYMYNGGSSVFVPGRPSWSSWFLVSKIVRKREVNRINFDICWICYVWILGSMRNLESPVTAVGIWFWKIFIWLWTHWIQNTNCHFQPWKPSDSLLPGSVTHAKLISHHWAWWGIWSEGNDWFGWLSVNMTLYQLSQQNHSIVLGSRRVSHLSALQRPCHRKG